jgi:D-psicose/D-tagatose/L-ribulose 3-epimerase
MISISNIGWDAELDDSVSSILVENGINFIDIAPSKYFFNPCNVTSADILKVKSYWVEKEIQPLGMQALLFGTNGLNIFGNQEIQEKLLMHLSYICKIGRELGAKKLVFGSPKNRDRSHLTDLESKKIAVDFFIQLGELAQRYGVVICLEPNPKCYDSNFMTDSFETAMIVEAVNSDSIRMQLDTGAMQINNEPPRSIIKDFSHLIHHIHISEPQLVPLIPNNSYHSEVSESLIKFLPNIPMTIEMLTSSKKNALEEITRSIRLVKEVYKGEMR